jgi:hypothetical protein
MITPRISKAIDIFLDALNKGELRKRSCSACAVGNLVKHGLKEKYPNKFIKNNYWGKLFATSNIFGQHINLEYLNDEKVLLNIKATDFTWQELAKIEHAFEINTRISGFYYDEYSKEEIFKDQLNGLIAVIEVMMDFDNCLSDIDELFTNKAIEQFNLVNV